MSNSALRKEPLISGHKPKMWILNLSHGDQTPKLHNNTQCTLQARSNPQAIQLPESQVSWDPYANPEPTLYQKPNVDGPAQSWNPEPCLFHQKSAHRGPIGQRELEQGPGDENGSCRFRTMNFPLFLYWYTAQGVQVAAGSS